MSKTKTTDGDISKKHMARLKVREAKHGSVAPRSKQLWNAERKEWVRE